MYQGPYFAACLGLAVDELRGMDLDEALIDQRLAKEGADRRLHPHDRVLRRDAQVDPPRVEALVLRSEVNNSLFLLKYKSENEDPPSPQPEPEPEPRAPSPSQPDSATFAPTPRTPNPNP